MTLEEIEKRIKNIDERKDDGETAHEWEDYLYLDFVRFIATSKLNESTDAQLMNIKRMAKEILKTADINFSRWYA